MIAPDPKLAAAAQDAPRARQMLNELHGQILNTLDAGARATLLGKYATLATFMKSGADAVRSPRDAASLQAQVAEATRKMNEAVEMLTRMMKSMHDQQKAAISNLRG